MTQALGAVQDARFLTRPLAQVRSLTVAQVFWFLVLHAPLALALQRASVLSTAHALAVFAYGLLSVLRESRPRGVVYAAAYITGCELLWRGTHAGVFWEFGKYSVSLLLVAALLKYGRLSRADLRTALPFALLLPAILVMPHFDRELVAFNLSGPLALCACSLFFSTVYIGREELERIYLALLAPIVGLATLATVSTLEADLMNLAIGGKATTAGIGPNQVSSMLGLGVTVAVLSIFLWREPVLRRFFIVVSLWLGVQGVFSLSRGGIWTAIGALAVAALYLLRTPRARRSFVLSASAIALILNFVLLPLMNRSTGGLIGQRFASTEMTGRDDIMKADLSAFEENPLLGVGPGGASAYHERFFRLSAAHTEYTRLLAEHGSLGLIAILIFAWISVERWQRKEGKVEKACGLAGIIWTFFFLWHASMRLVAPSFLFGLSMSQFHFDDGPAPKARKGA